jgi:hypothetical protein
MQETYGLVEVEQVMSVLISVYAYFFRRSGKWATSAKNMEVFKSK